MAKTNKNYIGGHYEQKKHILFSLDLGFYAVNFDILPNAPL